MAITDDFEVIIHSNGKRATEYDDDDNAETNATTHPPKSNHIVKYIEAVPGEFFEFHYRIRHPRRTLKNNGISFDFYVNGDYVKGYVRELSD
ncbi:hypothetical protein PV10_08436 [Exophiala mesophila]|uniref:DUF7918 domain-containing protein n=1 Tax=Exophiala mesophila TaxID=212818 RepID=A0A0D1ZPQ7_EXOME|nr:uncharacterized protein PV10_08436 [Exophiala mesophila]KIV88793.1 hypothetical protein PV10_08436 [Exophiala mesophila]